MESLRDVLARVTTITFDCYGTLIDWDQGLRKSFGELFEEYPASRSDEFFNAYVVTEAQVEAKQFQNYRDVMNEVATRLAEKFSISLPGGRAENFPDMLPTWTPFPDTNDALTRLKQKYRLGIMSNIDRDLFAETAKLFPIEFDFVVTAQDAKSYKPHLGHFNKCFDRHSTCQETLHVAQSLFHDGGPAKELGLAFVWINRYNESSTKAIPLVAEFADLKSLADQACG